MAASHKGWYGTRQSLPGAVGGSHCFWRRYTEANAGAYAGIEFRSATSEIRNPDGSVVFKLENMQVPTTWSQVAADILAQKYFRKAGVPARLRTHGNA